MTLRPLGDYVLVAHLPTREKTFGGLVIPESARHDGALSHGKVLAVGPGDKLSNGKRAKMNVRPGDTVLYWRNPPNDHEEDGQKRTIVHEEQSIAAVLGT